MLPALILAVSLTTPAPAIPEDPAVTVCELLVRQTLRAPDSFVRAAAPLLSPDSVMLAFSHRDARGRTVTASQTCHFRLSPRDGLFHLEALRREHLERRLAETRERLAHARLASETLLIRSEMLDIGREMFVQDDRRRRAEHLAAKAGIYPIAPARTALAVP